MENVEDIPQAFRQALCPRELYGINRYLFVFDLYFIEREVTEATPKLE